MNTSLSVRRFSRRALAVVVAGAVALVTVAATSAPSEAAVATQKVNLSVSTLGQAYTSSPVRADFTVANPSTNSASVGVFTIVVPAGVTKVTAAGVTGPGNWRQVVLPCGSTANCSALLLVYASLPLSTSILKPGKSLTTSITFTTGATPTTLSFPFLGIGNGVFTAASTPTIAVVSGDAAHFTLTTSTPTVTAGGVGSFHLTTQNILNADSPFSGGDVVFTLGTEDSGASLVFNGATYPFTSAGTGLPSKTTVRLPSSGAALGVYDFTVRFTAAGNQSVDAALATNINVDGFANLVVNAGPAAKITLQSVLDSGTGKGIVAGLPSTGPLFVGQPIVLSYFVTDAFNNGVPAPADLAVSASGIGTFTQASAVPSNGIDAGTVTGTYSAPFTGVSFGLSAASVPVAATPLSNDVVVGVGTGTFLPGVPSVLNSTNFAPPVNGQGQCNFTTVDVVCAQAGFGNGASGTASLTLDPCPADAQSLCLDTTNNITASLQANLKTTSTDGLFPLYSAQSPLQFLYGCSVTECPHKVLRDGVWVNDDLISSSAGPTYNVYNSWEESVEDYKAYPLYFQPAPTTQIPTPAYQIVPACQIGTLDANGHLVTDITAPEEAAGLASVTNLVALQAYELANNLPISQACVDVTNILRNTSTTAARGQVTFPIYFYDDPKIIVGR